MKEGWEKRNKKREWEMESENIDLYLLSGSFLSPWQGEHTDTFLFASLSLSLLLYASALSFFFFL